MHEPIKTYIHFFSAYKHEFVFVVEKYKDKKPY